MANEIKEAVFVKSSRYISECPNTQFPEYAFIGRSNVGKSSLINMMTNRKSLAKTSSTPGKTQLINHFLINNKWMLVDLPGYGFSKANKVIKNSWEIYINEYILQRESLVGVFVLIDIRLEVQKNDLLFMEWLIENQVPFSIIFTKSDKLSKHNVMQQSARYMKQLKRYWEDLPDYFITSSLHQTGKEDILSYIQEMNKQ